MVNNASHLDDSAASIVSKRAEDIYPHSVKRGHRFARSNVANEGETNDRMSQSVFE